MQRTKHGFTLVELLVVISIIGILIALLIPAVNVVREQSRQTACLNNQSQVAMAILGFESNHRRLPGVLNQIPNGGPQYTWFEAILPNIGRDDLWSEVRTNTGTIAAAPSAAPTLRIATAICPDDRTAVDPASPLAYALLSYGVNDQFFLDDRPLAAATPTQPVDRLNAKQPQANVSNLMTRPNWLNNNGQANPRGWSVSSSQTIMLGDNLTLVTLPGASSTYGNLAYMGNFWTMTQNTLSGTLNTASWSSLTFNWPSGKQLPISNPIPPTSPPSATAPIPGMISGHASGVAYYQSGTPTLVPGAVVVVSFFDGHGQIMPSDTLIPIQ